MEFTPTPQLNTALAIAKLSFEPIIADESASFNTKSGGKIEYSYADLADIIPAVTQALSEQGLALVSQITPIGDRLYLVSRLLHTSGESIESYYPLPMPDGDAKTFGIALTYGRRYNTLCLLEVNTVDDEQSKRDRKVKAAMEIKAEVNRQRVNDTPAPAKKPTSKPAPLAKSPPMDAELYPQHNSFFSNFVEEFKFDGVFDFAKQVIEANWKGKSRPGHLDQEQLEALMEVIACQWGVESGHFERFDLAQTAYRGRMSLVKSKGSYTLGEVRECAIAWRDSRIVSGNPRKQLASSRN